MKYFTVGFTLTDNGYPASLRHEAATIAVPNAVNIEDWGFMTSYLDNVVRIWDANKGNEVKSIYLLSLAIKYCLPSVIVNIMILR